MVSQSGCMNNFKSLLSFFNDLNVKLVADSYRESRAIQRNRETTSRIAYFCIDEGLNLFICVLEDREFLCSWYSKHWTVDVHRDSHSRGHVHLPEEDAIVYLPHL